MGSNPIPITKPFIGETSMMRLALVAVLSAGMIGSHVARADDDTEAAIEIATSAIGEVLALGDLCQWNFQATVEKLLQDGARALRFSAVQQKDARARIAAARQQTFGRLSAAGQARMRADVCKPEERSRLEAMLAKIPFD